MYVVSFFFFFFFFLLVDLAVSSSHSELNGGCFFFYHFSIFPISLNVVFGLNVRYNMQLLHTRLGNSRIYLPEVLRTT